MCERQDSKETAGSDCFRLRQSSNGLRPRVAPWPLKHKAVASPTLHATRLLLELLLLWTGTFPASWCMENGRARQQRPGCDTRASQHGRHLPLAVQPIACVHRARKCSHLTPHPSFYPLHARQPPPQSWCLVKRGHEDTRIRYSPLLSPCVPEERRPKKRLLVLSFLLTLWHYLPASMSCSLTNRKMPDSATCEGIFSKKGL